MTAARLVLPRRMARHTEMLPLIAGFALALVVLFPIGWMLVTTLKSPAEVFGPGATFLPKDPSLDNFAAATSKVDLSRYILNSVVVSFAVTAIHVPLVAMAGFGLAKFRFPGASVVLLVLIASLMIPMEAIIVPLFTLVVDLGWIDTYQGLVGPAVANVFGVMLIRQYARQLPDAVLEAARVEGASWGRILTGIALPMSWPAIGAASVIIWRESWDAFLWPLLVVRSPDLYTLPLGLARFQQSYATDYTQLMAISSIAMLPLVGLYVFAQRSFVRGIAALGPQ